MLTHTVLNECNKVKWCSDVCAWLTRTLFNGFNNGLERLLGHTHRASPHVAQQRRVRVRAFRAQVRHCRVSRVKRQ